MYAVRVSLKAIPDIRNAHAWYQKEGPGLAQDFLEELQTFVEKIAETPHTFSPVPQRDARFAMLKRFPYKIYFQINEAVKRVEIVAVVHKSRNPSIWKRRL